MVSNIPEHRFILLDRDGTIVRDPGYLSDPDQLEFLPGAVQGLKLMQESGFGLIIVTNQSGIGRGYFNKSQLDSVHDQLRQMLRDQNIYLQGIYYCPHRPEDGCSCRKPGTGLVDQAVRDLNFKPKETFVIGDQESDLGLALNLRAHSILVRTGSGLETEQTAIIRPRSVVDDLGQAGLLIRDSLLNPVD